MKPTLRTTSTINSLTLAASLWLIAGCGGDNGKVNKSTDAANKPTSSSTPKQTIHKMTVREYYDERYSRPIPETEAKYAGSLMELTGYVQSVSRIETQSGRYEPWVIVAADPMPDRGDAKYADIWFVTKDRTPWHTIGPNGKITIRGECRADTPLSTSLFHDAEILTFEGEPYLVTTAEQFAQEFEKDKTAFAAKHENRFAAITAIVAEHIRIDDGSARMVLKGTSKTKLVFEYLIFAVDEYEGIKVGDTITFTVRYETDADEGTVMKLQHESRSK